MSTTTTPDCQERIQKTGITLLSQLEPHVNAADPQPTVSPTNRLLCAGLAELARATGPNHPQLAPCLEAAAALSLLTKIDDQVIDAPSFHHSRTDLEARLRAYLNPTRDAIFFPDRADSSPRCQLGAHLGRLIQPFPHDRQEMLKERIARGWETQVRAVLLLTQHPSMADPTEVEAITTQISTDWLSMIALCGTLSHEVPAFSSDEDADFTRWGDVIQRADSLTDLYKDQADGHFSALPSLYWYQADPQGWVPEPEPLGQALDRYAITPRLDLPAPIGTFPGRPALADLLSWVQRMLLARHRARPDSHSLSWIRPCLVP